MIRIDYTNTWQHVMNRARRVGRSFKINGLNRYNSVSSKDRKFKDRLEHIESNILKGQTKTLILPINQSSNQPNQLNRFKPINLYDDQGDVVFGFLSPGELAQFVINGV